MSRNGMRIPPAGVGLRAVLVLLFLTVVITGCGGGSSGPRNAPPEAVFSVSADSGFAPLPVTFDASGSTDGDGSITNYAWTFGDGATGSGRNVQHTYQSAGTYMAVLTVTDNGGLTGTRSRQIVVSASPPQAGFTVSQDSGFAPLEVAFDASGSFDNDSDIVTYGWVFGDGETGSGVNVQHTFQTAGTYTAELTVTDSDGLTDTETQQIVVAASPPQANFTVTADNGFVPLTVTFDASASLDNDGGIVTYGWVFGDGVVGSGQVVQHTYTTAGSYTAILTVTDNDGLTDTRSQEIVVVEAVFAPEANFTVSTDIGSFPLLVIFNASGSTDSDGSIVSYAWNFGDGEFGSGVAANHTYTTVGTYTAELTVMDNDGLTDTQSATIEVKPRYTLSGTATSAEHMMVDSDVNDVFTTPVPNNSFAFAQLIAVPVTISGYVNVARAGTEGLSWAAGDTDDYFRAPLVQGMNITLYMVEDPNFSELSLYLYDIQQTLVDMTTTNANGIASLPVPRDGDYFLRVEADSFTETATVYALNIGLTGAQSVQYPLRLSDDFVPGEMLIRLEEEVQGDDVVIANGPADVSTLGFSIIAGAKGREKLLKRSSTVDKDNFFERLGVKYALNRSIGSGNMDDKTRAKMETLWMIRAMRRQPGVLLAEPNYIRRPLLVPNDTYYSYQWHYPLINLPEAWNITTGSSEVVVAVVDSGVLLNHPDLQGQLVGGYDFISDDNVSNDGEPGIDDNPDDPGDQDSVEGSSFHGTHVAGTIAAASDNGKGVAGIAWNARIMPLRVLGKGGGTTYDVIQAVRYAAGLSNDSGTTLVEPVDIINLSLGSEDFSLFEEGNLEQARQKGVIVIASAGNEGSAVPVYPAAYEGVVSVSAVTINETLAPYSNYGTTIDVAAPGGSSTDANGDGYPDGVLSTMGDDSSGGDIETIYAFSTGTSMAAPHVSGVAALMRSIYPGLSPEEFDALVDGGYLTRDIGAVGRDDQFGQGLIDAYKAVIIAREGGVNGGLPPLMTASPGILNFGTSLNNAQVTVKNGGGGAEGALFVTGFSSDASWMSVAPTGDVDAYGLGTYTVTVNRNGLAAGTTSTGTIMFVSNTNQVTTVSVVVQKASGISVTDGGYHYILLVDPETFDTIDQMENPGVNGVYEYSFSGLPHGETYVIFAGTDPNNDFLICDEGEACGAYISLDEPVELTVTDNKSGLDFKTDINISLPEASSSRFAGTALPLNRRILKGVAK